MFGASYRSFAAVISQDFDSKRFSPTRMRGVTLSTSSRVETTVNCHIDVFRLQIVRCDRRARSTERIIACLRNGKRVVAMSGLKMLIICDGVVGFRTSSRSCGWIRRNWWRSHERLRMLIITGRRSKLIATILYALDIVLTITKHGKVKELLMIESVRLLAD